MIATMPTAVLAADASTPWYLSQPVGVVLGAIIAGLVSYIVAARAARTQRDLAAEQRVFDRVEARRDSRKAACVAFLTAASKDHQTSKAYEERRGVRYGDDNPEDTGPNEAVEAALAELALEVPDSVYDAAVRLREVLMLHRFGVDSTNRASGYATDDQVIAAEADLRRRVRTMLAND